MRTVVRLVVIVVVLVHGLIHLLGAAKGLGWADVPQLNRSAPLWAPPGLPRRCSSSSSYCSSFGLAGGGSWVGSLWLFRRP